MLKASYSNQYRKRETGNVVFVYHVSGEKSELAAFKKAKGDNFSKADDGTPLFHTTRYCGEEVELLITSRGDVTPNMERFNKAVSLLDQVDGSALADAMASQLAADLLGKKAE